MDNKTARTDPREGSTRPPVADPFQDLRRRTVREDDTGPLAAFIAEVNRLSGLSDDGFADIDPTVLEPIEVRLPLQDRGC